MKERLNLQPEQVTRIEEIMKDSFDKREKIMKESRQQQPPDFSQIRQELTEIDDQEYESIEKILNEEQLETYKKYMEEKRSRRPPVRGRRVRSRYSNEPGGQDNNEIPDEPPPPPTW